MTDTHDRTVITVTQPGDVPDIVHPLAKAMIESGEPITPESMQKMLDLQQQWEANEARKQYTRALVDLKRDLPSVVAHNKAGHTSKYTDLAALIDAVTPHLATHGFSLSWDTKPSGKGTTVACVLTHCGGHIESISTMTADPDTSGSKNSVQAMASTVTYLQRYTLRSALGLATSDLPDIDARAKASPDKVDTAANLRMVALIVQRGLDPDEAVKIAGCGFDQWTAAHLEKITEWAKKTIAKRTAADDLPPMEDET